MVFIPLTAINFVIAVNISIRYHTRHFWYECFM